MSLIRFLLAILIPLAGGRIILEPFARRTPFRTGETLSLSLALGLGALTLSMLALSLAGIPFRFYTIAPSFFTVAFAAGVIIPKAVYVLDSRFHAQPDSSGEGKRDKENPGLKRGIPKEGGGNTIRMLLGGFLFLVLAVLVFLQYHQAFVSARTSDSLGIWGTKAKVFYYDGKIRLSFFSDPEMVYTHQDYPLFLPLAEAWINIALGRWDDRWGRLLCPTLFLFMLTGLFSFLQRWVNREWALLFCLLFSLNPTTLVHSSLAQADLPLAFFYGLGILLFLCWLFEESNEGYLLLCGFFCGLGGWVKHEGSGFFLALFLLLVLILLFRGKRKKGGRQSLKRGLLFLLPGLLAILPWMILRLLLNLQHDIVNSRTLNPSWILNSLTRWKTIFHFYLSGLFFSRDWNLFWFLLIPSTLLSLKETFRPPLRHLAALLLLSLLVLSFVYMITPNDPDIQMMTSFRRVTISLSVPAVLLLALQSRSWFHKKRVERDTEG